MLSSLRHWQPANWRKAPVLSTPPASRVTNHRCGYREYRNEADALTFNSDLARCVNDRLQQGLALAHAVLAGTRRVFDALTQTLLDRGALEGAEIIAVIETAEQGP